MSQARVLVDIPSRGTTALLVTATGAWTWAHPRETPRCLLKRCPWRGALVISEQLGRKTARGSAANVTPAQRDDLSPWVSPELNFADYYQGRGLPHVIMGPHETYMGFLCAPLVLTGGGSKFKSWCRARVSESDGCGFKSWFCCLLAVGPQLSHLLFTTLPSRPGSLVTFQVVCPISGPYRMVPGPLSFSRIWGGGGQGVGGGGVSRVREGPNYNRGAIPL